MQQMLVTNKFSGAKAVFAGSYSSLLAFFFHWPIVDIVLSLPLYMSSCCESQSSSQKNRNHISYFSREKLIKGMSCTCIKRLERKEK